MRTRTKAAGLLGLGFLLACAGLDGVGSDAPPNHTRAFEVQLDLGPSEVAVLRSTRERADVRVRLLDEQASVCHTWEGSLGPDEGRLRVPPLPLSDDCVTSELSVDVGTAPDHLPEQLINCFDWRGGLEELPRRVAIHCSAITP